MTGRLYDKHRWLRQSRAGGGGVNSSDSANRRPMPPFYARNRETRTGGQRPLMAGNLRFKHLGEPGRDDLPYLAGDGRHVLLHSICYAGWTAQRWSEAVTALAKLGLRPPTEAF